MLTFRKRHKPLVAVVTTLILMSWMVKQSSAIALQTPTLSIVSPGSAGAVLPEMDEFATAVLDDPWDMSEPTDLSYYRAASALTNSSFSNGIYSAQMTGGNGAERITLLTAVAPDHTALRNGMNGYNFPINADYYHFLSFRMYSSNPNCTSGLIQWFSADTYSNPAVEGLSHSFLMPPLPCIGQPAGWYVYTLDLKTIGIQSGSQNWTGPIRELLIHPYAGSGSAGATIKLDWARLTAQDPRTARPYTIQWTGNGSGGPVTLYASPNDTALNPDDIVIATGLSASGGSFVYQTGVLPAGRYYIGVGNANGVAWSAAPLIINTPPKVTIAKPSMLSGSEYSRDVIGNPWDMSDPPDIDMTPEAPLQTCVTNANLGSGVFTAVDPSPPCPSAPYSDPKVFLGGMNRFPPGTPDPVVDTNKYRYLVLRFYQAGLQDVANGWVGRFGWWKVNATDNGLLQDTVMSRAFISLEGWNTYKIDLWAPDIVDEIYPPGTPNWRMSQPNRLRIDPNELASNLLPGSFQIDWVKLTAMDQVARGSIYSIDYSVGDSWPVSLNIYYDTDTNPSNGRTLITAVQAASSPSALSQVNESRINSASSTAALTKKLYLPIIARSPLCSPTRPTQAGEYAPTSCFAWNTSNVPPGTYYICFSAQDPYNSAYRCSEAPVVVY